MTTWANRLNVGIATKSNKTQIKIKHTFNSIKSNESLSEKSNIPDYVRYERELNSDDDMIIYGNTEEKSEENIGNALEFVLNYFNASECEILFKFVLKYLVIEDAIDFMHCCHKYSIIMNTDNELLYFWKCIYERKWGKITMTKTRKSKMLQSQRLQEFNKNITDYKYWQEICQRRLEKEWTVKYDEEYNQLSFWRKGNKDNLCDEILRGNHYMIIVVDNIISEKERLKLLNK